MYLIKSSSISFYQDRQIWLHRLVRNIGKMYTGPKRLVMQGAVRLQDILSTVNYISVKCYVRLLEYQFQ